MTSSDPQTLHGLFQDMVAAHGDTPAIEGVVDGVTHVLTYTELDRLSAKIAVEIEHVRAGPLVALVGHVHPATHASFLAILQSGRTVVPIHPDEPFDHVKQQLKLMGVTDLITTDARSRQAWADAGIRVHSADLARLAAGSQGPTTAGAATFDATTAYIPRTSGSAGRPKLVPATHAAAIAAVTHLIDLYELRPGCRMSAASRLSFDVSVFEIFGALLSGATLVLPVNREPLLPANYVQRGRLTHWCSVPSIAVLAESMGALPTDSMADLRHTIFCGEPLRASVAEMWRRAAPQSVINNAYGPTEVTIFCANYRLPSDPASWPVTNNGTVPIGSVYPHLEYRVDTSGELMIRGTQRFRGYVDHADNAKRFWPGDDHASPVPADLWYRTGDRVEQYPVGGMVHLGRLDRQVKVRGYRIELSEVEYHLELQFGGQAAAVVQESGTSQHLVAIVARSDLEPAAGAQVGLPRTLPPHLRPERILFASELPLNANGKIDYARVRQLCAEDT